MVNFGTITVEVIFVSDIHDFLKQQRKQVAKQRRKEYLKRHAFDVLNLIIALLALVVAFASLFLP